MTETRRVPQNPPCPECGAERVAGDTVGGTGEAVVTYCEWCGAEYPVPAGDGAGTSPRRNAENDPVCG